MIGKIAEFLNSEWVGKSFVYRSKYGGETIGEIESVQVSYTYTWDEQTNKKFQQLISGKKSGTLPFPDEPDFDNSNVYTAIRPKVTIHSTVGVWYDLDEIFIITHNTTILN